ncbi:MAG: signal peptidase II [Polyangia bacterium]
MSPTKRRTLLFTVTAVVSLFLDQWTKVLARAHLKPLAPWRGVVVVDGYFDLRYSENTGVAFGMFQQLPGGRILLSLMALAALGLVFHYLRRTDPGHIRLHFALGLVGGGAVGNLLDRIIAGRVSDFIVWKYHGHEWPAFNVADAALVVGVCLMALDMLVDRRRAAASNEGAGGGR